MFFFFFVLNNFKSFVCVYTGFETDKLKPTVWSGGESEALARLERHLERKAWVASFGHPKMTPQSLLASQTGLSPYLRFGCLSTRLFYYQLVELYKKVIQSFTFRHCEKVECRIKPFCLFVLTDKKGDASSFPTRTITLEGVFLLRSNKKS